MIEKLYIFSTYFVLRSQGRCRMHTLTSTFEPTRITMTPVFTPRLKSLKRTPQRLKRVTSVGLMMLAAVNDRPQPKVRHVCTHVFVHLTFRSQHYSTFCFMVHDVCDHVLVPCDDDYFTCFNRRCIHNTETCNNRNDCGDNSDEDYTHARCLGEFA